MITKDLFYQFSTSLVINARSVLDIWVDKFKMVGLKRRAYRVTYSTPLISNNGYNTPLFVNYLQFGKTGKTYCSWVMCKMQIFYSMTLFKALRKKYFKLLVFYKKYWI